MIQVYSCQKAKQAHDQDPVYRNTVPFSSYCKKLYLSSNHRRDISMFYMGQFDETAKINLEDYDFNRGIHVCDIEGDWSRRNLNKEVLNHPQILFTMNSIKPEYFKYLHKICPRPTFSKLLMKLVKQEPVRYANYDRTFSFMGFPDPFGVRASMARYITEACADKSTVIFTDRWNGSNDDESVHERYINCMKDCTFSLCPRGTGYDSVRFLESCFFGKIPIVISNGYVFGSEYRKPFFFQIPEGKHMTKIFQEIQNMSIDKINEYSLNAIDFWKTVVLRYFKDPTQYFMDWYNARNT